MAIIRAKSNEIQCKIVYYGPGRGGKTTNLIMIHKAIGAKIRGELISINTAGDRTIFFDFLPMDLGMIRNLNIKISVYTVPGQVRYNDTRKLVLRGVDGVVFVADSMEIRRAQNIESFQNFRENLDLLNVKSSSISVVLQYNKRDLESQNGTRIMPIEQMEEDLNPNGEWPWIGASAVSGQGVKETFKRICMLTVANVGKQLI
ncbi:GTP-binding protein [Desulfomonile tiedjei]|uniref:Putative GTPase n=1 Tax=Desulfomonile tiedjei (strain ATCC 49306 / DSM 6799 / DCB-1) TaxID=706587 RepID=I4BZQ3_DESTA|nr:GTPase domain-containing protein [Desulfomonile tiedjei]AFM22794.1 putative GTPase [Desulfomonile tiedjei DSM 6799]